MNHQYIRVMKAQYIERVVEVHAVAIRGFFLSSLGSPFMRELYMGIIQDPTEIAFVALRRFEWVV